MAATGPKTHDPIFVVGAPRSGNTLTGCILNKHPELVVFFEQDTFYSLRRYWREQLRDGGTSNAEAIVDAFLENRDGWVKRQTSLELEPRRLVEEIEARGPDANWPETLQALELTLAERIRPDVRRWGDKSPRNVTKLTDIVGAYPEASIVFVYRDPRDVVTSLSNPDFPHASDDPLVCAEVVRHYWRIYRQQRERVPAQNLFEMQYEALVDDPRRELQGLTEFLGIEFMDALLEDAPLEIRNAIGWPQFKAWSAIEPQPSSARARERSAATTLLFDLRSELGYVDERERPASLERLAAEARTTPFRGLRYTLQHFWRRRNPGEPYYLLHDYPDIGDYLRWIRDELKAS